MPTPPLFPRLLAADIDGRCQSIRYRQLQFHQFQTAVLQNIAAIKDAIATDSEHSAEEVRAEICLAMKEIRTHYASLDLETDLQEEYRVANGKNNPTGRKGVGIVYVVPGSHTLFFDLVAAWAAAVAGGNCVVFELPKNTMSLPGILRKILPPALDADTFAISEERPDAGFLSNNTLVILQGHSAPISDRGLLSSTTARTVAVVDRTADIPAAAEALVSARFAFAGRATYSPDLVLVQEFIMKEFTEAVIQRSSRYLGGQNGEARQTTVNPRRASPGASLLDAAYKDASARVVVSGSEWGVVEVLGRKSPLLRRKISEKVLIIHPVSSLDDAIDFSNSMAPFAATYAFAAPSSAKYLTQFIDAHISWVNHFPTDILIGPTYPPSHPPPGKTRYSTSWLQVPRPQFVSESENAGFVRGVLDTAGGSGGNEKAWEEALTPLPAIGRPGGKTIGFFEQGMITGGVVLLVSVVGTVVVVGGYGINVVRGLG
ncbi:aldehyde dehydrogenase PutA [Aspergillus heteromorphus CBS 117.55]|uniref:Aldehyde dehydrogenase PutA n=1 Tax=Aspergillus heteromorphus CBS 117.55 TaxID=1448321 RepID=A0A317WXG5_9EURO|nr:aldehyde dehydrogenase PutA [Aspergillus heteromorphus CBS 117.55]PWY90705.1 aldehyde dehydrogenase PutA [Aspergillus heteromorphus CBS 117.55]